MARTIVVDNELTTLDQLGKATSLELDALERVCQNQLLTDLLPTRTLKLHFLNRLNNYNK